MNTAITKNITRLVLGSLFAAAALASAAQAVTLTYQEGVNGYAGTADTGIRNTAVTTNYGSTATLVTRYTSNSSAPSGAHDMTRENSVVFIRFDDLNLTGAVASASLTLTVSSINSSSGGSASIRFFAYEMLTPWTESGATWNVSDTGTDWQAVGARGSADRNLTSFFVTSPNYVINHETASTLAVGDTVTITLPASLVQSWINDPSNNYGILLSIGATSQFRYPEVSFHSSEAATASLRPLLTLTGDLASIPEPTTVALLAGVICGIATLAIRRNRSID